MTELTPLAALHRRAELKAAVRAFFTARQSLEVDTPVAVVCPGTETHLRYFETAWRDFRGTPHRLYLRSSPELHMKQVLALGAPRIFQMAACFRSGGELADWHHPEFTMLEWYDTGTLFDAFIDQTEALLRETHARLGSRLALPKGRFPRLTVAEAFKRWVGTELIDGDPDLAAKGRSLGALSPRADDDFETAFFKLLMERIEPGLAELGGAVLVDYPPSQAALAAVRAGVAKRFEFYIGRVELCNGFEELLDADANRQRIAACLTQRRRHGYEVPLEDEDFYAALASGLAPCCGNALGLDRWLALLLGEPRLERILPFRRAAPYGPALRD